MNVQTWVQSPYWVENGAIWLVNTNLLIGFTDYGAVQSFFNRALAGGAIAPAPATWYARLPSGAMAFPALNMSSPWASLTLGQFLLWVHAGSLSSIRNFFAQLPLTEVLQPTAASGPLARFSALTRFQANSPRGPRTFTAQYVLYGPNGSQTVPGGAGWHIDLAPFVLGGIAGGSGLYAGLIDAVAASNAPDVSGPPILVEMSQFSWAYLSSN